MKELINSFNVNSHNSRSGIWRQSLKLEWNKTRDVFRTQLRIYDGAFLPLPIFAKKLHRKILTGFWICLEKLTAKSSCGRLLKYIAKDNSCIKYSNRKNNQMGSGICCSHLFREKLIKSKWKLDNGHSWRQSFAK